MKYWSNVANEESIRTHLYSVGFRGYFITSAHTIERGCVANSMTPCTLATFWGFCWGEAGSVCDEGMRNNFSFFIFLGWEFNVLDYNVIGSDREYIISVITIDAR